MLTLSIGFPLYTIPCLNRVDTRRLYSTLPGSGAIPAPGLVNRHLHLPDIPGNRGRHTGEWLAGFTVIKCATELQQAPKSVHIGTASSVTRLLPEMQSCAGQ
jgi:hypothetical protein